jgi:peptide/nickel transport system permease protein
MTDVPATGLPMAEAGAVEAATAAAPPQSPWRIFWLQFRRSPTAVAGGAILLVLYALALLAPFVAPYAEDAIDREHFYHPPMRLHWVDARGELHLWPFAHPTRLIDEGRFVYTEDRSVALPLRLFVAGSRYRLLGIVPMDRHLFGVDPPGRLYLLGTDGPGRDVLSRLLYGSQVSLTVGLIGIAISFTLGLLLGGVSGYFGGTVDNVIMRATELLLTIPGLYLLIALRNIFPTDLASQQVYLGIVIILAFIGWASLARVVRGMVLSIRRQEYVTAAEALGMGRLRVIARHILPNTLSFVIVAATVSIPGYILGEVFLSFIGLGVQEPAASWGNMLNQARSLRVLTSFPWMLFAPGAAIFVTVLAFNFLGDGLRDAIDPRRVLGSKTA